MRRLPATALKIALALGLAAEVPAQTAAVWGSVVDEHGEPLGGAHIYLAGSMHGTITRPNGEYRLEGVPRGAHRIVASSVGYQMQTQDMVIREPAERELQFVLAPAVYELGEVDVSAREQRRWLRRLARFERTLFGTSSFADSVRLLNPEVLDFSSRLGKLTATARAPLEIENRALGYRIRYDLAVFEALPHRVRYDGEPFFEELEPRNREEAAAWAANREVAYRGSMRHLLRSMIAGAERDHDFLLIHRPDEGPAARGRPTPGGLPPRRQPIHGSDILRTSQQSGEYVVRFSGLLEVRYEGEGEDERFPRWEWNQERYARPQPVQRSEIYLNERSIRIDHRGELVDPFSVTRMGYFAFRRLAMLLPVEYGLEGRTAN